MIAPHRVIRCGAFLFAAVRELLRVAWIRLGVAWRPDLLHSDDLRLEGVPSLYGSFRIAVCMASGARLIR